MKRKIFKGLKVLGIGFIVLIVIGMIFGGESLDKIHIDSKHLKMDVNEEKEIALTFSPEDAHLSIDDFQLNHDGIVEIKDIKDHQLIIKSLKKSGDVTLQYKDNNIKSNAITIQVVDQKALAALEKQKEEEAKEKAEQLAKEKAEEEAKQKEAAKKAEEEAKQKEAAKKAEEEKQKKASEQKQNTTNTSSKTKSNTTTSTKTTQTHNETGSMVYIPKTGKKYHSNSNCSNMKNPRQVSITEAKRRHYEPCKKCYR